MKDEIRNDQEEKIIKFPERQRKNDYKSSKSKNKSKTFFLWVILMAVVIFIFCCCTIDSTFDSTNAVNTETISLSNANNYDFTSYKDGYILAKDGKISCYNTNQSVQWEISGSKTTPKVSVNEKYTLTYYADDAIAIYTIIAEEVSVSPENVKIIPIS